MQNSRNTHTHLTPEAFHFILPSTFFVGLRGFPKDPRNLEITWLGTSLGDGNGAALLAMWSY